MFKIIGRSKHAKRSTGRDVLDREETREAAERSVAEHRMALGEDWTVYLIPSQGEERYEQVIQLSAQGLTIAEISKRTGLKYGTIQAMRVRLIGAGRVQKRSAGQRQDPAVLARNEQIAVMRETGKGPIDIARELGMKHFTVRSIINKLRLSGRLPRLN